MSGAQAELWPNLELVLDELDEREEDLFELEVEFEETSFDSNQFRRAALNGKNYQSLTPMYTSKNIPLFRYRFDSRD